MVNWFNGNGNGNGNGKPKVMPPTNIKTRSRPTNPHTLQNTPIILYFLDKSKDNLMMANTQGRNM